MANLAIPHLVGDRGAFALGRGIAPPPKRAGMLLLGVNNGTPFPGASGQPTQDKRQYYQNNKKFYVRFQKITPFPLYFSTHGLAVRAISSLVLSALFFAPLRGISFKNMIGETGYGKRKANAEDRQQYGKNNAVHRTRGA
jgi:hypothetical protein